MGTKRQRGEQREEPRKRKRQGDDAEQAEKSMKKRRRGHHEGCIHLRTDGRWVAVVDYGYIGGKRKRKHLYGSTRAAVAAKLRDELHKQSRGAPVTDDQKTVSRWLDEWLALVKPSLRARTFQSYEEIVRLHLKPGLGRLRVAKLTASQVQRFLNEKRNEARKPRKRESGEEAPARKLSPRRIQRIHAVLKTALESGVKWGELPRNVAKLATPPKAERHEGRVLTEEQARALLAAVRDTPLDGIVAVAVGMGLRIGEALGLLWSDTDTESGALTVSGALQRQRKEGLVRAEPKSKTSRRTLRMPPPVIAALRRHRARQAALRLAAGPGWVESGYVFTSRLGRPLDPKDALERLHRVLGRAGLPRAGWHDLRRSCASILAAQGVPPATAMAILGHSSIVLTMDVYTRTLPSAMDDAAARMGAALEAKP